MIDYDFSRYTEPMLKIRLLQDKRNIEHYTALLNLSKEDYEQTLKEIRARKINLDFLESKLS